MRRLEVEVVAAARKVRRQEEDRVQAVLLAVRLSARRGPPSSRRRTARSSPPGSRSRARPRGTARVRTWDTSRPFRRSRASASRAAGPARGRSPPSRGSRTSSGPGSHGSRRCRRPRSEVERDRRGAYRRSAPCRPCDVRSYRRFGRRRRRALRFEALNEMGPEEAAAAGDQDSHRAGYRDARRSAPASLRWSREVDRRSACSLRRARPPSSRSSRFSLWVTPSIHPGTTETRRRCR